MNRKKYFPPELKRKIAEEAVSSGNISLTARRYETNRESVRAWIRELEEGTLTEGGRVSAAAMIKVLEENRELKRLLAEKELEKAILDDLLKKTSQRSETEPKLR